jgi:microcystin-dependent protein
MADPFIGEIKIIGFNYPPRGWAFCNGQLLPINQNQALFSLLGTTYGGNGSTTFALPDLRGRVPVHVGSGYTQGQRSGEETHTLTPAEMPTHQHTLGASNATATFDEAAGAVFAGGGASRFAPAGTANTALDPRVVQAVGGSQPHENRQPYLVLNFAIALTGIFPSRT